MVGEKLEEKVEIKVFDARNFVLNKEALNIFIKSKDLQKAWANGAVNTDGFIKDLSEGRLNSYFGDFVAYYAGVFCGHSTSKYLFKRCLEEYGIDTAFAYLATFQVPQNLKKENIKFEESIGMFLPTMDWYRFKLDEK